VTLRIEVVGYACQAAAAILFFRGAWWIRRATKTRRSSYADLGIEQLVTAACLALLGALFVSSAR